MSLLILAALLWLGVHIGLAGTPARAAAIGALGEQRFKGVFSLLSLATLVLLLWAFHGAGTTPLWVAPAWFIAVVDALMLLAFLLMAGAVIKPRGAGAGGAAGDGPRGIFRVTRHPLMAATGLWAGLHLLANGDTASIVFFGAFLLTVLFGLPSADAKLSRRDPAKAASLHGATSILPFLAIATGRNRLSLAEIGWVAPLVAVVVWVAVLHLHQWVIGVSPLPVW